jgi:hypothetical protein
LGRVPPRQGGGRVWGGGMRAGAGGKVVPCPHVTMDLERLIFYIDYEAFKQWH